MAASRTVLFPPDPAAVAAPSCSLVPDAMRRRGDDWATLRDRHMIDRQRIGNTLTSRWRPAALSELRGLVEAEHECCAFFAFELTIAVRSITLRTTFPASMDPQLFTGVG
jgi:hypothetical protein